MDIIIIITPRDILYYNYSTNQDNIHLSVAI